MLCNSDPRKPSIRHHVRARTMTAGWFELCLTDCFFCCLSSGSYECLDDDVNEDAFSVSFSDQETSEVLYQPKKGTLEGVFKFDNKLKQGKRYALCFENTSEEEDDEWDVGFSMRVTNAQRTLPDDELGPDSKRALQLVNKATAIHEDWSSLRDHFDFLRNREAVHKHLSDATMSRLQRWTWIEAILVTSMATGQILYWRRFFEQRRYL